MKKLIEELEAEYKSDKVQWGDGEYQDGFNHARMMVMAHNPWHDVGEKLPESKNKIKDFSIVVNVTDGMRIRTGYFDYGNNRWIVHDMLGYLDDVIKWAYLLEIAP